MKRILAPMDIMHAALTSLDMSNDKASDIIAMLEIVDAGHFNAVVMPELYSELHQQLSCDEILKTLFAFWQGVVTETPGGSLREYQALGGIRAVYFMALNLGHKNLSMCINAWWQEAIEIHGSPALGLWA